MYQIADLPDFSEGREMLFFVVSRITASPAESDGRMLVLRSTRVRLSDSLSKAFRTPPPWLSSVSFLFWLFFCELWTIWTILCWARSQFCNRKPKFQQIINCDIRDKIPLSPICYLLSILQAILCRISVCSNGV